VSHVLRFTDGGSLILELDQLVLVADELLLEILNLIAGLEDLIPQVRAGGELHILVGVSLIHSQRFTNVLILQSHQSLVNYLEVGDDRGDLLGGALELVFQHLNLGQALVRALRLLQSNHLLSSRLALLGTGYFG